MGSPGGFATHPGLFRVPDLLSEEQFVDYMWATYGRRVEFVDTDDTENVAVSPARALGQSFNISPLAQVDGQDLDVDAVRSLTTGRDPVLEAYNNRVLPKSYDTNPIGNNPADDDSRVPRTTVESKSETVSTEEAENSAVVPDESSDDDDGNTVFDYNEWKHEELVDECRRRQLAVSGTKAELAERLRQSDNNPPTSDED